MHSMHNINNDCIYKLQNILQQFYLHLGAYFVVDLLQWSDLS